MRSNVVRMDSPNKDNLHRDRGYRFGQGNPTNLLYQTRIAVNNANLWSWQIQDLIIKEAGEYVAIRTIDNLMDGTTIKPHLRTVELIMYSLGYNLQFVQEGKE